jgi:hypothetical protein
MSSMYPIKRGVVCVESLDFITFEIQLLETESLEDNF